MTTENNAAPSGLTDDEILKLWKRANGTHPDYGVFGRMLIDFARALLDAAPKASEQTPIATFDDGSKVVVDSWTGGAHDAGSFGGVTLRFMSADGTQKTREYRALDLLAAEQAGQRIGTVEVVAGHVRSYTFEQTDTPDGSYPLYAAPLPRASDAGAPAALTPYDGLTEEFTDEVARLAKDAPGLREAVVGALESCGAWIVPRNDAAAAQPDHIEDARELVAQPDEQVADDKRLVRATALEATRRAEPGIYVASRASIQDRPDMWKGLRQSGWPIISTWIDEAGEEETSDFEELWCRIHREIQASAGVLLYAETDDFPLKGALIECGLALGMGKPIAVVLPNVELHPRSMKPIGSWVRHPAVTVYRTLTEALDALLSGRAAAPQAAQRMSDADSPFANDDERTMFIQTMEEFEDCNETVTDDRLLMRWACAGLLECNSYLVTEKGGEIFDAVRKADSIAESERGDFAGGEHADA